MSGARALDGLAYRMSLLPRDKINLSISTLCVLELRLISMDGATQFLISKFEVNRWHNSKSLCAVLSGLKIPKLPTGQILDLGK